MCRRSIFTLSLDGRSHSVASEQVYNVPWGCPLDALLRCVVCAAGSLAAVLHSTSAKIYGPRRGGRVVQVRIVLPVEHVARSSTPIKTNINNTYYDVSGTVLL